MRIEKLKVFNFDELEIKVQQKVIEKNQDINIDYEWYNPIMDNWQAKLEKLGYNDPKVAFDGFYNQGDGACFTADIDLEKIIRRHKKISHFKKIIPLIQSDMLVMGLTHSYRYYFATSTDLDTQDYRELTNLEEDKLINELEQIILKERENLGNEIYQELQEEYEALTSDEAIRNTLQANSYEFTAKGEIF